MKKYLPGMGLLLFVVTGCAEPVREDRAADWERDGSTVAFQHDKEGVFVADKQGNKVERIFQPDESVLATSRPLYSPVDGRLIFTTARDLGQQGPPQNSALRALADPVPPEGSLVWQRPVNYTCWLRAAAEGDEQPAPRALFTARCEHVGYIAAGLAVRWHPDGQRVLYIDSTPNSFHQHGVYEFDLQTEATRSVFPHRADALIFDFTPRGSHLVCVTGTAAPLSNGPGPNPSGTGIWIGNPDDANSWWHVPQSDRPAVGELPSQIESLRASRPAWTADDLQFASVVAGPEPAPGQTGKSLLQVTPVATRTPEIIHESAGQLTDLNWSPDGARLGFIERRSPEEAALQIYDAATGTSEPVDVGRVGKFAGFDRTGARLAYVVAEETDLPALAEQWALLLIPDRLARDKVVVAEVGKSTSAVEVFSGTRITFPVWSPTEDRLSLWITFVPRYRSLLSLLRQWGLLPGDPAATLDLTTGAVSWLAVNPAEEMQVGHYYLLKKEYARAWEWYERANQKLPPRRPPRDFQAFTQALGAPEQSQLFEYLCLTRLGRRDEAQARLNDFERNFFPSADGGPAAAAVSPHEPVPNIAADLLQQLGREAPFLLRLIHDLYMAEVFLGVDDPPAGITLLREQLASNDTGAHRLSRLIALAQLLLVAERFDEYVALCPEFLKPLDAEMPGRQADASGGQPGGLNATFEMYVSLICLAPLFRREFVANLSDDVLASTIDRWGDLRKEDGSLADVATNLFLRAAHQSLGNAQRVQAIEERLARNPVFKNIAGQKPFDEAVRELFAIPGAIGQLVPRR
jgi:hypothetical protein